MPLASSSFTTGVKDGNRKKVRFMCSHAGKIIPRPSDRKLRYVGGETRMICLSRSLDYPAFIRKMTDIYGPNLAVKYQLPGEDLDALVSVSCDEDLENMMDECDRLEFNDGSLKLRVFVSSPFELDDADLSQVVDPVIAERRYVNAVNALTDKAPVWKQAGSLQKDPTKTLLHGFRTSQVEDRLFDNLNLDNLSCFSNELIPGFGLNSNFSTLHQDNQLRFPLQDQTFDENSSRAPFVSEALFPAIDQQLPSKCLNQDLLCEDEVQISPRLFGNGLFANAVHAVMCDEGPLLQLVSIDIPCGVDAGEANARFRDWWHVDPSSPGASLLKQLESANESMQESKLDNWYIQQHILHNQQNIDQKEGCYSLLLCDPWTSLVGKNELTNTRMMNASPVRASGLHDLELSSQNPDSTYALLTSSKVHTDESCEGHTRNDTCDAIPVPMECSKRSCISGEQEWGDGPPFGNNSNHVFQTCYITLPLSRGLNVSAQNNETPVIIINSKGQDIHEVPASQMDFADTIHIPALPTSSIPANSCMLNTRPNVTLPSATFGQPLHRLSEPPVFDEAVNLMTHAKGQLEENSFPLFPAHSPSPPVNETSIIDTRADSLQLSQPKDSLPLNALSLEGPLHMSTVNDKTKLTAAETSVTLDSMKYMHAGAFDEPQGVQSVGMISSQLRYPNNMSNQLNAYNEEAVFYDQGNSDREEVFSALASLRSCYETDAEPWLVGMQNTLQDASLVTHRKVAFEDGFDSMSDSHVNTAAIAEAEAKAHGLQIIKNADLEELRELGSGTFGTVYHGKWRGTDVAIKRIKSSCFMGKPSERERLIADFLREACILGQLHHPNVVAFYGIVPDGPSGTLATVTEYMVDGSLKKVLVRKDRTLDRRKRLLIAMDAAFGMEYLHGKNVVHFDLKCENLLVNLKDMQRPICKVADLGLSKVKKQTMVSGGVRGTLPWMAPELLSGSNILVSEKIDVFSFGIVMWELLTGEEPYANMHYGAIIGGIVNNTLRPPVPKWCDAAWKSLMEKCWAADPFERPTFSQIAAELRAMETSKVPRGRSASPPS